MNGACQYNRASSRLRDGSSLSGGNTGWNEMHLSDSLQYSTRFIQDPHGAELLQQKSVLGKGSVICEESVAGGGCCGKQIDTEVIPQPFCVLIRFLPFFFWGWKETEWGGGSVVWRLHNRFFPISLSLPVTLPLTIFQELPVCNCGRKGGILSPQGS